MCQMEYDTLWELADDMIRVLEFDSNTVIDEDRISYKRSLRKILLEFEYDFYVKPKESFSTKFDVQKNKGLCESN